MIEHAAHSSPGGAGTGGHCGLCAGQGKVTFLEGVWTNNPISIQILGICSALAVTNRLANALVMGGALIFVTVGSNLFVSLLRHAIPRRIRMIAEVAIIATFVIVFDQFLRAFYYDMSRQLGPYVGLIITNCIVMGRAEAFALQNPPLLSIVDGFANGLGYALVLACVAVVREGLGAGSLLGLRVLPAGYVPNQVMVLAPGAFIVLGFLIALYNVLSGKAAEEEETTE